MTLHRLRHFTAYTLPVLCLGAVGGRVGVGQTAIQTLTIQSDRLAEARARLKAGSANGVDIEAIAEGGATEAIPELERQFELSHDHLNKLKIAQALVRLKDPSDVYWNYLRDAVQAILDSDIPNPFEYDRNGEQIPGLSREFQEWMKKQNVPPSEAAENALYMDTGQFLFLGGTHDARAIPLLRRALSGRNVVFQLAAATSLAELQDKGAIPLIIDVCRKAPKSVAVAIAAQLAYFDDVEAQKAVDAYVPVDLAKAHREARAKGGTALHH